MRLPSYTQLGMAALLPNKELTLASEGSGAVCQVAKAPKACRSRKATGNGRAGDRAKALKAEEYQNMRVEEGKELFRDNDIVYIYHNHIDAIGDKLAD